MITPKLARAGQVEVPFQCAFFLGYGFPTALPWAEREVPLAGRRIANHPENSYMWYNSLNALGTAR
jgi:hypothetical protein